VGNKKWGKEIGFADLAVSKSLEHNRSLKMMKYIWDGMCRQMAFNLVRGSRLIVET
jgi:hypothetical protein